VLHWKPAALAATYAGLWWIPASGDTILIRHAGASRHAADNPA